MPRAVRVDLFEADAFEDGVDAEAAVSSRTRSTASSPRSLTMSVAPNSLASAIRSDDGPEDDLLGAETPSGDHPAQADGAVPDDGRGLARADLATTAA